MSTSGLGILAARHHHRVPWHRVALSGIGGARKPRSGVERGVEDEENERLPAGVAVAVVAKRQVYIYLYTLTGDPHPCEPSPARPQQAKWPPEPGASCAILSVGLPVHPSSGNAEGCERRSMPEHSRPAPAIRVSQRPRPPSTPEERCPLC